MKTSLSHKCPLCQKEKVRLLFKGKDFPNTQEEFDVVECEYCKLRWTNPTPFDLKKYYHFRNYFSHQKDRRSLLGYIYDLFRFLRAKGKFRFMQKCLGRFGNFPKGNTIQYLDFGCGIGEVLRAAKKEGGWEVFGVEVDEKARKQAIENGFPVYISLKEIPNSLQFDLISLWHVLEHVSDPLEHLQDLKGFLKPGGLMVIAIPNSISRDALHYGKYWAGWDLPRHLYHFTPETLKNCLQKIGLHLLLVKPQWWDTYYVSLLSERYKGNPFLLALFLASYKATYFNLSSPLYHRSALIFVCRK